MRLREQKRASLGETAETGYLARRRVKPITLARYQQASRAFTTAFPRAAAPDCTISEFDLLLERHLTVLFFDEGARAHDARNALYGSAWMRRVPASSLPAALSSLDGFKKEDPGGTRDPCPWEAVLAIAVVLMRMTPLGLLAAAAVLLAFSSPPK